MEDKKTNILNKKQKEDLVDILNLFFNEISYDLASKLLIKFLINNNIHFDRVSWNDNIEYGDYYNIYMFDSAKGLKIIVYYDNMIRIIISRMDIITHDGSGNIWGIEHTLLKVIINELNN